MNWRGFGTYINVLGAVGLLIVCLMCAILGKGWVFPVVIAVGLVAFRVLWKKQ